MFKWCWPSIANRTERGSAIMIVMFMSGLTLTLVAMYVQSEGMMQRIKGNKQMRDKRDQVGKTVLGYLSNHEVVKQSGQFAFTKLSEGNLLLYNCLNATDHGGKGCRSFPLKSKENKKGYHPYPRLVVVAPTGFAFPPDKKGRKNCPSKGHPSCYLGGYDGPSGTLGYNFEGETGKLSACFPLEPVVYINPDCGRDDAGRVKTQCDRAQDIRLAYQLVHRPFKQRCEKDHKGLGKLKLASAPKRPEFITLPRHTLVDYECNTGAFVKGYEAGGDIVCECQFPYVPIDGVRNERGVVCQEIKDTCPAGSLFVGRDRNNRPVCKRLDEMSKPFTQSMEIATSNYSGSVGGGSIACNEYGWLNNLDVSCTATQTPDEIPGVGYSCLMFYGFVKLLDGQHMIDGMIPTTFYPDGEMACYAYEEVSTMRAPQTPWDFSCVAAISGLLMMASGAASSLKNMFVKRPAQAIVKKSTSKVMGKAAGKAAAKAAAAKLGAKASKGAIKKAQKAAYKAAYQKGGDAAMNLAKQGFSKGSIKKGAKEAASMAAAKAATESLQSYYKKQGKVLGKFGGQKLGMEKLSTETFQKGLIKQLADSSGSASIDAAQKGTVDVMNDLIAREVFDSAQRAASKKLDQSVKGTLSKNPYTRLNAVTSRKLFGNPLADVSSHSGSFVTKSLSDQKSLSRKLTKRSKLVDAKDKLRVAKAAGAAGAAAPFANLVLGDLSPALFAQTAALDIAIDAAGMAGQRLLNVPIVGWALYIAFVAATSFTLASWSVMVSYNCYPIVDAPAFSCTLNGTCFDFDNNVGP